MSSDTSSVTNEFKFAVERSDGTVDVLYEAQPKQQEFHEATELNVLMGGGAGSGKSTAMRYDAYIRCWSVKNFRVLIVRRTFPELKASHIDAVPSEAERMGLSRQAWHATDNVLRFPNGSQIRFGHVEDDAALMKYLSSEYDAIYFDELTTFTLNQFIFLSSRARTTKRGLKPIIRAGTNPIGPGATWVRQYFVDKNVREKDNPGYNPSEWRYIHSTYKDNRHINQKEYQKRLQMLPSKSQRRALEDGEWVIDGQFFSEWVAETKDGPWHVRDSMPTYKGTPIHLCDWAEVVVAVDWGYAEEGTPGMALWFLCLDDGSYIAFREYVFKQTLPKDVALTILEKSEDLRIRYYVGDPQMFTEHEGPSIAELMAREGVSMIEADHERVPGWVNMHVALQETVHNGVIERPKLSYLKPQPNGDGCPVAIQSIPNMVVDPKKPHDMVTVGVEDEASDTTRYFLMSRPGASSMPKPAGKLEWIFKQIRAKQLAEEKRKQWR